jgi:hypothetical protein
VALVEAVDERAERGEAEPTERHEYVPEASHYIQFDRPDVVVRTVRETVEAVRANGDAV